MSSVSQRSFSDAAVHGFTMLAVMLSIARIFVFPLASWPALGQIYSVSDCSHESHMNLTLFHTKARANGDIVDVDFAW